MKKKIAAAILTAAMVLSLAACGGSGSEGKETASGEGGKEPYTVTMVLQGSQPADEERIEEKINEILEKEVNANLDIVVLPWASAAQQLQLMLAGDEKNRLLLYKCHKCYPVHAQRTDHGYVRTGGQIR